MTKGQKVFMWSSIILVVLCLNLQYPLRYASIRLFHADLLWVLSVIYGIVWGVFAYISNKPMKNEVRKGGERFFSALGVGLLVFGLVAGLFEIAEWFGDWNLRYAQYFFIE